MRNLVVSLVLATVGIAPVFAANPTPTAKEEPKKGEEVAAKAEAPKAKTEKGAAILLTACNQCATDQKKDMKNDQPQTMKPEATKPATTTTTPKSI